MRKLIGILLALWLLFSLGACAGGKSEEENTSEPESYANFAAPVPEPDSRDEGEKIIGTLYAVFGSAETEKTNEFSFYGGTVTPERIAAGLTGWTGLKFRIHADTDETEKTIRIDFLADSSFATGEIPEEQREDFTFSDTDAMRLFMLGSLTKSIQKNMGEYEVFFTVDGNDIAQLGLQADLRSDVPYTVTD